MDDATVQARLDRAARDLNGTLLNGKSGLEAMEMAKLAYAQATLSQCSLEALYAIIITKNLIGKSELNELMATHMEQRLLQMVQPGLMLPTAILRAKR